MKSEIDKNAISILERAKNRIINEEQWTKHVLAKTVSGSRCDTIDNQAVSWCLQGAISVEMNSCDKTLDSTLVWLRLRNVLVNLVDQLDKNSVNTSGGPSISKYNDLHSHCEVIHLVDKALTILNSE